MLLYGSAPNHSAAAGKLFFLLAVRLLRVWMCSPSVFQQIQTHKSISSRESRRFVRYMYCTKVNSPEPFEPGLTMWNRNSTLPKRIFWLVVRWQIAEKTVLQCFPGSTFDSFRNRLELLWVRECFYDAIFILLLAFELWNKTFEDESGLTELQMNNMPRLCAGLSDTSFIRLTNVCMVLASRNDSMFVAAFPSLLGTSCYCKAFSMQHTVFLKPSLTKNGAAVETRACFSGTALLLVISVLCSSCLLRLVFKSTADSILSGADVRGFEVECYGSLM